MIIAGIDEAGYGPLLGPLVVGCCAFEVTDAPNPAARAGAADLPCIWSRLRRSVSRTRSKTGKTIHVNDSKLVYSPSIGLKELERSILSLAAAGGTPFPATLDDVLGSVAPHCVGDLAEHAWYLRPAEEPFPVVQDGLPIRLFAKSLAAEMEANGARCVWLAARVLCERPYNKMVAATRNKASVLFTQAATHLDHLLRTYGHRDLTVFCDRQGGRSNYAHLLRLMFEDWSLEVVEQTDGRSEYLLRQGPNVVRLIFAEKAEAQCLPVAVASMVSKYLRESLMRRYNAYWTLQVPGVTPTAGYHPDGVRFASDIAEARQRLGVPDEDLLRSK